MLNVSRMSLSRPRQRQHIIITNPKGKLWAAGGQSSQLPPLGALCPVDHPGPGVGHQTLDAPDAGLHRRHEGHVAGVSQVLVRSPAELRHVLQSKVASVGGGGVNSTPQRPQGVDSRPQGVAWSGEFNASRGGFKATGGSV
eukprot:579840-Prorocentrum_minimum.AAC.2